jgi:hypothetical protein
VIALSSSERMHSGLGGIEVKDTGYLYSDMNQSHDFVDCIVQSTESGDSS